MNINYIVTPLIGSVIGYTTNWLAIKMLFKPHNAHYIGRIKIPFTPGLIPKERDRIAKSLGQAVGGNLLTEEVILSELTNPKVIMSLKKYVMENVLGDSICIDTMISNLFEDSDRFYHQIAQHIKDILVEQLKTNEQVRSHTENILKAFLSRDILISDMLGPNVNEKIDGVLFDNKVVIAHQVCLLLSEETTAEKIKSVIGTVVTEKIGGLAAMFIQPTSIYGMIVDFVNSYFESEEHQDGLIRFIIGIKNKSLNNSLPSILEQEQIDDIAVQLNGFLHAKAIELADKEELVLILSELLKAMAKEPIMLTENVKALLEKAVEDNYRKFALTHLPVFLDEFNVTQIVETQINKFSVNEVEDLIFKIVDKELNAITWLGALLGLIMGTLTLFF